ncbi:branched-chain amino acid transaminase [Dongshaea marina]|uniref:branched-chain amino acid transaminase n=1 Tax=Dongshaea marina TaxID=2047966 RepID=UPI000D3E499E|nr:branched-chain amino acid transaminase [Dongshaea marina]
MTHQADYIWHNGKLIPWHECTVHVMSHALHYGSSFFEGIRCYETPEGPALFRHKEHMQRLLNSAKIYQLSLPYSTEDLMAAARQTISANKLSGAYIRPLAFVGNVGLGVCPPRDTNLELMIAAFPWGTYLGEDALEQGIDATISSWSRMAPNTLPTAAKAGGNYLSSMLIGGEARRNGYGEGIALDVNGYVSEGAGENLFIVRDGVLHTPPATSAILPGITRDSIITLARDAGLEVREEKLARESLYLADELFMTGTAAEITPVRSVDGARIGCGKRGPITELLQQKFFGLFNGQTEDKWGWLDYVESQES